MRAGAKLIVRVLCIWVADSARASNVSPAEGWAGFRAVTRSSIWPCILWISSICLRKP